jgi:hypothetical protein
VQAVTYVAGPVTLQLMLKVMCRISAASSGVNFTSARPFQVAFVVSIAVGRAAVAPVQFRLVRNKCRET